MHAPGARIRVSVNGEAVEAAEGTRLLDWLAGRGVDVRRLAVERNREVIPRAAQPDLIMVDGDSFEVVHFVGGG